MSKSQLGIYYEDIKTCKWTLSSQENFVLFSWDEINRTAIGSEMMKSAIKILSKLVKKFSWFILIRSYQDLIKICHEMLAFQALGKMFQDVARDIQDHACLIKVYQVSIHWEMTSSPMSTQKARSNIKYSIPKSKAAENSKNIQLKQAARSYQIEKISLFKYLRFYKIEIIIIYLSEFR